MSEIEVKEEVVTFDLRINEKQIKDVLNSNNRLRERVDRCIVHQREAIDFVQAMEDLEDVGKSLVLAYAGTYNYQCNIAVTDLLLSYTPLINNALLTSHSFISSCINAINNHQDAFELINECEDLESALEILSQSHEIAESMVIKSNEISNELEKISELAKDALKKVQDDNSLATKQREEIDNFINGLKADSEKFKSEIESLKKGVENILEKEKKAEEDANFADNAALALEVGALLVDAIPVGKAVNAVSKVVNSVGDSLKTSKEPNSKDTKDKKENKEKKEEEEGKEKKQTILLDNDAEVRNAKEQLQEIDQELKEAKAELSKDNSEKNEKKVAELSKKKEEKAKNVTESIIRATDRATAFLERSSKNKRDIAMKFTEIRLRQEVELRTQQGDMAKRLEQIKNSDHSRSTLDDAIHGLQIAINTMMQVQQVFNETKDFWEQIAKRSSELTSNTTVKKMITLIEKTKNEKTKKKLLQSVTTSLHSSAFNWLVLGQLNSIAFNSMSIVKEKNKDIMTTLPTEREKKETIERLSKEIEEKNNIKSKKTNEKIQKLEETKRKQLELQTKLQLELEQNQNQNQIQNQKQIEG